MSTEVRRGRLFVGCIIALVATALGFAVRGEVLGQWESQFNLSQGKIGIILGAGLYPFAISIILFSLIVDRIGYGTAMAFAFIGHVASAIITICAGLPDVDPVTGYRLLYTGTFIYALANGIVEAVINPVTATLFPTKKTHYLNILHAGWPLGLVLGAMLAFGANYLPAEFVQKLPGDFSLWQWKVALVLIPTLLYGILLFRQPFPVQERVSAGVSYREMMQEFGAGSCFIVLFLLVTGIFQILNVFDLPALKTMSAQTLFMIAGAVSAVGCLLFAIAYGKQGKALSFLSSLMLIVLGAAVVLTVMQMFGTVNVNELVKLEQLKDFNPQEQLLIAGGATLALGLLLSMAFRCFGRPMFVFLLLVMFLLATTELGTDSWIQSIMKDVLSEPNSLMNYGALVLAYTSLIMFVLRFFAGPIVHRISPLGLLAVSAAIACGGLLWLAHAGTTAWVIFAAATLYAFGKTFFWPTTLGVVSEQFPKGGALTLNAIAGVGMIAVGVLGNPLIGDVQDRDIDDALVATSPAARKEIMKDEQGLVFKKNRIDQDLFTSFREKNKEEAKKIDDTITATRQKTLMKIAILPGIMFVCYILLIFYFRMRGGYKAEELDAEIETRDEHVHEGGRLT